MSDFLRNLAFLAVLAVGVFIIAPDIMGQVLEIYGGLGIMPIIIVLIVLAALPPRKRRRMN